MKITNRQLFVYLLIILIGGIGLSLTFNLWDSNDGSGIGGADGNTNIRGSMTLVSIADTYDLPLEYLQEAFNIPEAEINGIKCGEIGQYTDSVNEIGVLSMKFFVAAYHGEMYDVSDEAVYLPQSALNVLLTYGSPLPEQVEYMEQHIAH